MDIEKMVKAVKLCGNTPKVDQCKQCAYWSGGDMSKCIPRMTTDAATALSTLQAENKKLRDELKCVTAERDAAIEDLLDAAITPCSYCKQNPNNGGACDMDNDNHEMFSCWEWRGIEEG